MPTSGQRLSSSSRDLTLVVESESDTPEEYFAQVNLTLGRAKSNTIYIDHQDVDHIHAKVVKRDESFWLRCEPQAKLQVLDPEPGVVEEVELIPGLTIQLGGTIIRCRQQIKGMGSLSDDYWANAAGGERFRVETDSFTGDLPKKIGPYEIRKFVARGGMGIVLQGLHEETAHLAAVKLPTPDLNKDQQWLKRFELEVRTLKSVTHPNLVRLQDAGQEGELHWMAMDWVEGWTVAARLSAYKEAGEAMSLPEIQLVLQQVVAGLKYLHSYNVVHRDLKPGNLLVGQDGGVKVADFGLAKQVGGEQSTFLTRTGTIAGTMHYLAPEQAEGMDITPATDVYAFGVIWHELLTGRRPGHRLKIQAQRSDCPDSWVEILGNCLEEEPRDRPCLNDIKQALEVEVFEAATPREEPAPEEPLSEPEEPGSWNKGDSHRAPIWRVRGQAVAQPEEEEPAQSEEPEGRSAAFKIIVAVAVIVVIDIIFFKGTAPSPAKPQGINQTSNVAIGTPIWEFETGGYVNSSPVIGSDGTVYVGSDDNKLYALSGKSGVKLLEFETGGMVRSSPAIGSDGTVYVGSHDKKLYAIKTESLGLAKSPWPMRGQNARHTGRVMKK